MGVKRIRTPSSIQSNSRSGIFSPRLFCPWSNKSMWELQHWDCIPSRLYWSLVGHLSTLLYRIVTNSDRAMSFAGFEPLVSQIERLPRQGSWHCASLYQVLHMNTTLRWPHRQHPTSDTNVANGDSETPFADLLQRQGHGLSSCWGTHTKMYGGTTVSHFR